MGESPDQRHSWILHLQFRYNVARWSAWILASKFGYHISDWQERKSERTSAVHPLRRCRKMLRCCAATAIHPDGSNPSTGGTRTPVAIACTGQMLERLTSTPAAPSCAASYRAVPQ